MDRPITSFGLSLDEMVISRLLEQRAQERPDARFVFYGDEVWSFAEVDQAASRLAGGLRALGIRRGDRVALFLPNGPAFMNTYFALCKLGATTVSINTAYRGYMLEYVLNDAACELVIADATLLDHLTESAGQLAAVRTVVVAGDGPSPETPWRMLPFDALVGEPLATDDAVTSGDVNCVVYTSGTTGPSKGVPITNAHGVGKAIEVIRLCEIAETDVIYAPLPLFHSFALLRGVVAAIVTGGSCALRERFSASKYWDDVRRLGATVGYCVFSIPQILKKAPPGPTDRDHTLRCLYNARHDAEFEARFGVRLVEAYGLTEAGVAMYVRPGETVPAGSCGRVSEDWEVRLVDDRDVEVPWARSGRSFCGRSTLA